MTSAQFIAKNASLNNKSRKKLSTKKERKLKSEKRKEIDTLDCQDLLNHQTGHKQSLEISEDSTEKDKLIDMKYAKKVIKQLPSNNPESLPRNIEENDLNCSPISTVVTDTHTAHDCLNFSQKDKGRKLCTEEQKNENTMRDYSEENEVQFRILEHEQQSQLIEEKKHENIINDDLKEFRGQYRIEVGVEDVCAFESAESFLMRRLDIIEEIDTCHQMNRKNPIIIRL